MEKKKRQTPKPPAKKQAAKHAQASRKKPDLKRAAPNPRVAALEDIKLRGLYLHGYAITMDAAPVVFDTEEFRSLVDQFYEENKDLVTPVVHRACRENYEFFMTIVEKTLNQLNDQDE